MCIRDRLQVLQLPRPLVLALPRGGVPVGFEIAAALDAPLDVLFVRKLGAPGHPELGLGQPAARLAAVGEALSVGEAGGATHGERECATRMPAAPCLRGRKGPMPGGLGCSPTRASARRTAA